MSVIDERDHLIVVGIADIIDVHSWWTGQWVHRILCRHSMSMMMMSGAMCRGVGMLTGIGHNDSGWRKGLEIVMEIVVQHLIV